MRPTKFKTNQQQDGKRMFNPIIQIVFKSRDTKIKILKEKKKLASDLNISGINNVYINENWT